MEFAPAVRFPAEREARASLQSRGSCVANQSIPCNRQMHVALKGFFAYLLERARLSEPLLKAALAAMMPGIDMLGAILLMPRLEETTGYDVLVASIAHVLTADSCSLMLKKESEPEAELEEKGLFGPSVPVESSDLAARVVERGVAERNERSLSAPIPGDCGTIGALCCCFSAGPREGQGDQKALEALAHIGKICHHCFTADTSKVERQPSMMSARQSMLSNGETSHEECCSRSSAILFESLLHNSDGIDYLLHDAHAAIEAAMSRRHVQIFMYDDAENILRHYVAGTKRSRAVSTDAATHQYRRSVFVSAPRRATAKSSMDVWSPVGEKGGILGRAFASKRLQNENGQMLVAPLLGRSETYGVVQVSRDTGEPPLNEADAASLLELSNQVAFVIGYSQEQFKMKKQLNLSEAIFESMSNGVISTDEEGRILKINAVAQQMLGVNPESDVDYTRAVHELFQGDDEFIDAFDNVVATSSSEVMLEHRLRRRSSAGRPVDAKITIAPLIQLARTLRVYGMNGVAATDSLKNKLETEMESGKSTLQIGADLLRVVDLVLLRIVSESGDILLQFDIIEGATQPRCRGLLGTKKIREESELAAAKRVVLDLPEELRPLVKIREDVREYLEQTTASTSMKEMRTRYNKTLFEATLPRASELPPTFQWVSPGECEKLGVMTRGIPTSLLEDGLGASSVSDEDGIQETCDALGGVVIVIEDVSKATKMYEFMTKYMNPRLAKKLLAEDENALGGRLVPATMLFSDIRSFTTLTEAIGPQETVAMLNEYFEEMVQCVLTCGGIVDKFIGDAIMAVWGTPFEAEDDADRAVEAALLMMKHLARLNERRASAGKPKLHIGIGINSGDVVSGNIGSSQRMEYTVIGDDVNLGSRLEAATKEYGVSILVSESTRARLRSTTVPMREIDLLCVKGKTEPRPVWEPLHGVYSEEGLRLFREGLQLYRRGEFLQASGSFERALVELPNDGPSNVYIQRCAALIQEPPAAWDGVWRMKHK
eukprot:TRINITY_DN4142_c0_g2_i1.p1 TRINITY_DN4142_c0_g2~~TRINITY_DN4142_c0_g2_i1.p1  ORF type:complete len:1003 (-),score=140.53 TRINITY_DN4142_c0_g2_i1:178-3186(-)